MQPEELNRYFEKVRTVLEEAYLSHEEPWRQSGSSGPEERWVARRKPIADCIDHSGSFLDIGCANGYLLECCLRWTAERGLQIDPYGVDLSPRLVALARQRLPQYADHLFVGNAWEWIPPWRFDFVRTELVYVPTEHERQYVQFLREHYLQPGGRLLVANYTEDHPHPERGVLPGCSAIAHLLERLSELELSPLEYRDGYDPIKDRKVRIAVLADT